MTKSNSNLNNSITPEPLKGAKSNMKKVKPPKITKNKTTEFKKKYFEYYDDVKTHNNGPHDW